MRTAHAQRTRRWLWKAGVGVAVFIVSLVAANAALRPGHAPSAKQLGHDFLAFYTAGAFVGEGRSGDLYDLQKVSRFQAEIRAREGLADDGRFPFWNPPVYAVLFVPLAKLSFPGALGVWYLISLGAFAVAMVLLGRMMTGGTEAGRGGGGWRTWGLVPLFVVCSMPFIQTLTHAQNSAVSLLLVTAVVLAWRKAAGRRVADIYPSHPSSFILHPSMLAGLLAGLMFYKPQLGAILGGVMAIHLGRRAIAGMMISGGAMLGANAIVLPGTLMAYLHRLPANLHAWQVERAYYWHRHVTFKAFWRLLIQGNTPGEMHWAAMALAGACVVLLAAALLATAIRCRKSAEADGLIAATIAAAPLLMPFYFDYDLLLLAVPAVLLVRRRMLDEDAVPRGFAAMLTGLYIAMYFTPAISDAIRINLTATPSRPSPRSCESSPAPQVGRPPPAVPLPTLSQRWLRHRARERAALPQATRVRVRPKSSHPRKRPGAAPPSPPCGPKRPPSPASARPSPPASTASRTPPRTIAPRRTADWPPTGSSPSRSSAAAAPPACLKTLYDLSADPALVHNARTATAITIATITSRHKLTAQQKNLADEALRRLLSTPAPNATGNPQKNVSVAGGQRSAEATPGMSAVAVEDFTWQLHLAVAKAEHALGQPIHKAALAYLRDPRATVRRAFSSVTQRY